MAGKRSRPRIRGNRRERIIQYLIDRDGGDKCVICGVPFDDPASSGRTIDHADGDPFNNRIDNLRLVCRNDNSAKGRRYKVDGRNGRGVPHAASDLPAKTDTPSDTKDRTRVASKKTNKNEDANPTPNTQAPANPSPPPNVSANGSGPTDGGTWGPEDGMTPTMRKNAMAEPAVVAYVLERIMREGSAIRGDLIEAAAMKADCSTQAARSYIGKLTSSEGPLEAVWDQDVKKWIVRMRR